MPESIQLKVGGANNQQSAVYDEFARNVPGFKPLTDREMMSIQPKPTQFMEIPTSQNNANIPASVAASGSASNSNQQPQLGKNVLLFWNKVIHKKRPK